MNPTQKQFSLNRAASKSKFLSVMNIMNKKFISVSCIVLVSFFAAILNVSTANAAILTTLSGTKVVISNKVYFYPEPIEKCGVLYNYRQRMVIDGKTELVLTDIILTPGTHTLTFMGVCEGYNLYGVGSCSCLNAPKEIVKPEQIRVIAPKPTGFLCIRKNLHNEKVIKKELTMVG